MNDPTKVIGNDVYQELVIPVTKIVMKVFHVFYHLPNLPQTYSFLIIRVEFKQFFERIYPKMLETSLISGRSSL